MAEQNKMLIDATHPEETRVVVLRSGRVEEFDYESAARKQLRGNIYLAKVTRVEPSLQAAFVDYGGNRHGFLAFNEIHPDYYQIPMADRQALIEEEAAAEAAEEAAAEARADARARREAQREAQRAQSRGSQRRQNKDDGGEHSDNYDGDDADDGEDDDDEVSEIGGESVGDLGDPDEPTSRAESTGLDEPRRHEDYAGDDDRDHDHAEHEATADSADSVEMRDGPDPDAEDAEEATSQGTADGDDDRDGYSGRDSDENGDATADLADAPSPRGLVEDQSVSDADAVNGGQGDETVEQVGSEDALEELPSRPRRRMRHYKIQEVIKRRQVILVQVVKEERGNKGAALTTYLSLAGRYTVLMPNTARGGGISRKITQPQDRKRLKAIAAELDVPEGMGLIIRTAGAARTKQEIKRDFEYLLRLWESVRDLTLQSTAPSLVYEEGDLIKRSIRDLYNKDVDEIIVAGEASFREAKDFMRMLMPSHAKNVINYDQPEPLFTRFQIERQLNAMFSPYVTLKSGGYLVINQTEALVAIDVNSGKATREFSIEETALNTNLEASDEIARQLKLRDLAGLIVIDFIDMEEKRNNRSVERRLKDALRFDRARIQVGRISHFGLMEMSRQRLRTGVLEGSTSQCPHCQGTGIIRSVESVALAVLRGLEDTVMAGSRTSLTAVTTPTVALYILNKKRAFIIDMEARHGLAIAVEGSDKMQGANFSIEKGPAQAAPLRRPERSAVKMDWGFGDDETDDVSEADDDEPTVVASTNVRERGERERGEDREGDDRPRRRRRRRGRRGERNDRDFSASTDDADDAIETMNGHDEGHSDNANDNRRRDRDSDDDDVDDDGENAASADGETPANGESDGQRRRRRRGRRGGRRNRDRHDRQQTAEGGDGHADDQTDDQSHGDDLGDDAADRDRDQASHHHDDEPGHHQHARGEHQPAEESAPRTEGTNVDDPAVHSEAPKAHDEADAKEETSAVPRNSRQRRSAQTDGGAAREQRTTETVAADTSPVGSNDEIPAEHDAASEEGLAAVSAGGGTGNDDVTPETEPTTARRPRGEPVSSAPRVERVVVSPNGGDASAGEGEMATTDAGATRKGWWQRKLGL